MSEHPITASVRESKERAQAIVSQIFAKETPSADDLHHLAVQYIATEAVGKMSKARGDAGLYFEHPAALDPPPAHGEYFLVVHTTTHGLTAIVLARWNARDKWWTLEIEALNAQINSANTKWTLNSHEIYAMLRIPSGLSEAQRLGVDTERELLEEDRAESEGPE